MKANDIIEGSDANEGMSEEELTIHVAKVCKTALDEATQCATLCIEELSNLNNYFGAVTFGMLLSLDDSIDNIQAILDAEINQDTDDDEEYDGRA